MNNGDLLIKIKYVNNESELHNIYAEKSDYDIFHKISDHNSTMILPKDKTNEKEYEHNNTINQ